MSEDLKPDHGVAASRGWFDRRLDLTSIRRALLDRLVPDRLTWWHTLGSAALTVFLVQVVTGVVLATFYSPSPDHAYESVLYLQREVSGGAFLRALHHWGSSAMVVLVLAHMVRVFGMGAYKFPREPNWVLGVLIFFLVLGFGFTGYLLPWDQRAYWATQVGTSIAGTAPVVGGFLARLLKGGPLLGTATLARFYAFHVLWLPIGLGVMIALHLAMVVRQGIAPRTKALETDAPPKTSSREYAAYYDRTYAGTKTGGVRFWPDIIAKDIIASFLVIVILVVVARVAGAPLEPPADPTDASYVPRPEWYFLPFFQLLKLFPGSMESTIAIGVPIFLVLALVGLPFFDRGSKRNLLHRPAALASLVVVLGGSGLLLGAAIRDVQPTIAPETGKLLSSSERAGRALFERQCSSCHKVATKGGDEGPELTDIGLNHTSGWLHSFMELPVRFHPDSKMSAFGPPVLSHQEIEEVARYLATLHGPPASTAKPEVHDTFPEPPAASALTEPVPAKGGAKQPVPAKPGAASPRP